jgi:class 3 adenylate cyclase
MNTIDRLPRIDKYTCRFENPVMEERYMAAKWARVKKAINFAMIFMALVFLLDAKSAYSMSGGFHPVLLCFPVFIALFLSFLWWPERFKARHFDIILSVLFLSYHGFQIALMLTFPEAMETSGMDGKVLLAFLPCGLILMMVLLPLNFLVTLVVVGLFLGSFAPMLMEVTDAPVEMWVFTLVLPFVILTYNKYRSEFGAREDFAKTVSLDEAQDLMQQTLRRYFGDVLSDKMLKEGGEIEGENRWVSISFTDIASYSTITENMSPEVALEFLNEYFTGMHEVIKEYNGHILNYIGDAVMVVFGAPEKLKNHENQALLCAIKMEQKLAELNRYWDENETSRYWKNHGIKTIGCRTGIHTGSVIAGNIGSKDMLQYTTIGDAVNVAARLEQSNKEFQTTISFSHEIYTALTKDLHQQATMSGEIVLKGRTSPTKVYTIPVSS